MRLKKFGINEKKILEDCEHFGKVRNDIAHEKALEILDFTTKDNYVAREESKKAITFVKEVSKLLKAKTGTGLS